MKFNSNWLFETRNIERLLVIVTLALGFCQVWTNRYEVGVDIISYLDLGNAIFRQDWPAVLHGLYWPPLYSIVLGLFIKIFRPSLDWEYPLVQGVNFLIFLAALASFRLFLKEFLFYRNQRTLQDHTEEDPVPGRNSVIVIAYALFIWSSIDLIGVSLTNPDMLLAALLYLAAALLLKVASQKATRSTFALFGLALGLGYLTKAALFPLAFVYLGAMFWMAGQKRISSALIAVITFLAVSVPFVCVLSLAAGRPTFSDQGPKLYAMLVDSDSFNTFWQGEGPLRGKPLHPTNKIFDNPAVFEFATPITATYAPYYGPIYWLKGLQPYFDVKKQTAALFKNGNIIAKVFVLGLNGTILAGFFLLLWTAPAKLTFVREIARFWFLLLPSFLALILYSIVHVEPRYIGTFAAIISLLLIASSQRSDATLLKGVAILMLSMSLAVTFPISSKVVLDLARGRSDAERISAPAASELIKLGLRNGNKIVTVNSGSDVISRIAYLARVRIVADCTIYGHYAGGGFWAASPEVRRKIIDLFDKTGASMIISTEPPQGPDAASWITIVVPSSISDYKWRCYVYELSAFKERYLPAQPASNSTPGLE